MLIGNLQFVEASSLRHLSDLSERGRSDERGPRFDILNCTSESLFVGARTLRRTAQLVPFIRD
jgi:hypothetical protein